MTDETPTLDSNRTPQTNVPEHRMATLRETLDADRWATVNRSLLAKMLSEFTFEGLIDPEPDEPVEDADGDATRFRLDLGDTAYRFAAAERRFDSYHVVPNSVECRGADGEWTPATDAIEFLLDAADTLDVPPEARAHLVREHTNTLLADAHVAAHREATRDSFDPTALSYAELDAELDAHPWITYNKGRIGFGYDDYLRYAPESRTQIRLRWVAARRGAATFASVEGFDHDEFVAGELREGRFEAFRAILQDRDLDPDAYYFLPVHPWQWDNSIASFYAGEIARDDLVPLGAGRTNYRPLQSIRTLANADDPESHYVKLPLRVLNTLVYRGIPGEKIEAAPRITEVLHEILDDDPYLSEECGLILPGEVASVNYDHPVYGDLEEAPYQHRELLGVIWRESVHGYLGDDEQAIPLAALLREDGDSALLSTLVEDADVSVGEWFDHLFDALLPPLLHFTYRYGIGFCPHGEDTILVLEDGLPTRIGLKDFIDLSVSERRLPEHDRLPDWFWDVLGTKSPDRLRHCIVSSLLVCVLRYVADIAVRHHDYDEDRFWRQARERVLAYHGEFPELEDRFELFDLLDEELTKLCLNRNRLTTYGYEDAGSRPSITGQGTLPNALHRVAED